MTPTQALLENAQDAPSCTCKDCEKCEGTGWRAVREYDDFPYGTHIGGAGCMVDTGEACTHPGCFEPAPYQCDHCNGDFCPDHGTKGGDRRVEDVGAVAYPSACWECGGFNADE
jgi:hypothetical protein